jgi:hypothetical protein
VFINGCHTTNLEPERAFEFVSAEAGEAVRLARLELLGRSLNPLGLLYVPYMLSTIRMATASA